MDADFSHRPEDLPFLLQAAADGGGRGRSGRATSPAGASRAGRPCATPSARGAACYARLLLGLPVRDCTSGFKCFRREALEALDLDALRANGYAFQVEVNYACARAGLRLAEVPIVFPDRTRGRSKMSARIALEAAGMVLRLRLAALLGRCPAVREVPARRRAGAPGGPRGAAPAAVRGGIRSRREPGRRPAGGGLARPLGAVRVRRRADALRLGGRRPARPGAGAGAVPAPSADSFTVLLPARHEEAVIRETIQRVGRPALPAPSWCRCWW